MARTSRRERLGLTRGKGMEQVSKPAYGIADAHSVGGTGATGQKTYSVGIYARLSVDSHNEKNESIDNQIEMANPTWSCSRIWFSLAATAMCRTKL